MNDDNHQPSPLANRKQTPQTTDRHLRQQTNKHLRQQTDTSDNRQTPQTTNTSDNRQTPQTTDKHLRQQTNKHLRQQTPQTTDKQTPQTTDKHLRQQTNTSDNRQTNNSRNNIRSDKRKSTPCCSPSHLSASPLHRCWPPALCCSSLLMREGRPPDVRPYGAGSPRRPTSSGIKFQAAGSQPFCAYDPLGQNILSNPNAHHLTPIPMALH